MFSVVSHGFLVSFLLKYGRHVWNGCYFILKYYYQVNCMKKLQKNTDIELK